MIGLRIGRCRKRVFLGGSGVNVGDGEINEDEKVAIEEEGVFLSGQEEEERNRRRTIPRTGYL